MRESLIDQWYRENTIAADEPSTWAICLGGALRGATVGIALVTVLGAISWIAVLQKV